MNKGKGHINEYKGGSVSLLVKNENNKPQAKTIKTFISKSTLDHSTLGEYQSTNRPRSGGHGQESIDYMDKHGIPYEINEEYNNGVRAGNLPTHKNRMFKSGNKHTWFPKSWTRQDIKSAGEFVANQYKGTPSIGAHHSAIYAGVKVTVIFGNHGEISTIFPSADQPGGKKK